MIFSSGYHHNRQKKFFFYQSLTDTIRPDIGGEPFREIVTASQKLEIKLNKKYEKQIKIEKGNTISGNIVYSSLMTFNDSRRWKQTIKEICISSISQDTVYAATSGLKKPQKHLTVGLSLNSLTGSKKVVEMMCRLGHCASCHTIKEIENEMTIKAANSVKATPFGMSLNASTATGVAWDNFDRFVETKSGKDTLHDTVGITYQLLNNSRPNILENSKEGQNSNENTKLKKWKC